MKTVKLKDVCTLFLDGDWIESKDQANSGIRLIQTGNIGNGYFKDRPEKARFISDSTFDRINCTEILPGDLLVSRLPEPVGRACIIPKTGQRMITAVDCTIIRPNKNILQRYLLYFMQSHQYFVEVEKQCSGATRKRISRKKLGDIQVPAAPIETQDQLVKKLDAAFEKIDKAVELTEKTINYQSDAKNSLLNEVFSKQNASTTVKLGDIYNIKSSKRVLKSEWRMSGIPFYRGREITRLSINGNVDNTLYIEEKLYEKYQAKYGVPKTGDIMITAIGTIGNAYIVKPEDKFYFKDASVLWMQRISDIQSKYIWYWIKSNDFKNQIGSNGTTVDTLTISKLQSLILLLPSRAEQQSIVTKLDTNFEKIDKSLKLRQRKLQKLHELKQSLLAEAFDSDKVQ